MPGSERRQLLVSKGWVQAVVLVMLFGFFVLGLLAYRTYQAKPPTPERVVDPNGRVLYTAQVPDERHERADRVAAPARRHRLHRGRGAPDALASCSSTSPSTTATSRRASIAFLGIRHTVKRVTLEEPADILFTEVAHPEGVPVEGDEEATAARLT